MKIAISMFVGFIIGIAFSAAAKIGTEAKYYFKWRTCQERQVYFLAEFEQVSKDLGEELKVILNNRGIGYHESNLNIGGD